MSDLNNTFGLDELDDNVGLNVVGVHVATNGEGEPVGLVLPTLSLSDEDLDASSGFTPIPAGTTTQFMIYDVEPRTNSKNELVWNVTFQAVEDTWGKNRQIRFQNFLFRQTMAWKWGPFLKAVGLVEQGGQIDQQVFTKHEEIKGLVITAHVDGYTWKGADGSYQQSFGGKKRPVPEDGTPYYESLGRFKKYEPADNEDTVGDEDLAAGASFSSTDEYL